MGTNASALVGYAVLRANYDTEANSYLDNFQKFVICTLSKSERTYLENSEISRLVSRDFGISIPTHVVPNILKRTRRSNLTELVGQTASKLTPLGKQEASNTLQQIVQYNRTQTELVTQFQIFVKNNFPERSTLTETSPDLILSDYFDRHAVPIVDESVRGQRPKNDPEPGTDFLVSAFLTHLSVNDQVRFNYAVEAAKGAMLAAMLTLDTTGLNDSLKHLTLVLDTPVLMELLGFHGEIPERSMNEIIDLAKSQSAKIVTFAHCIDEVTGILRSVENNLRNPTGSRSTMQAYLHFMENGSSPSDLEILISNLDSHISDLGIETIPKPENYYTHGLDEERLEELIDKRINYALDQARVNDVHSISAVHRLRKGVRDSSFERCVALLITTNSTLAKATVTFKGKDRGFPLALDIFGLASILWVRTPAVLSDVPKQLLISSAYAGMQPSPHLWGRYLEEIDKLESKQSISPAEAVVLRSTTVSRTSMMEETLGESEYLPTELPIKVLDQLREEHAKPYRDKIEELERSKNEATGVAEHSSAAWLVNDQELESTKKKNIELEEKNKSLHVETQSTKELLKNINEEKEGQLNRLKDRADKLADNRWNLRFTIVRVLLGLILLVCIVLVLIDPLSNTALKIVGGASLLSLLISIIPKSKHIRSHLVSNSSKKIHTKLLKNSGLA